MIDAILKINPNAKVTIKADGEIVKNKS